MFALVSGSSRPNSWRRVTSISKFSPSVLSWCQNFSTGEETHFDPCSRYPAESRQHQVLILWPQMVRQRNMLWLYLNFLFKQKGKNPNSKFQSYVWLRFMQRAWVSLCMFTKCVLPSLHKLMQLFWGRPRERRVCPALESNPDIVGFLLELIFHSVLFHS